MIESESAVGDMLAILRRNRDGESVGRHAMTAFLCLSSRQPIR